MKNSGAIRVGIGGWGYPPWRGAFYPPGLRQAEKLASASRHVTAIEINGTFYRIQAPASFKKWHDETPDDFVFSLKGPRFLTHRAELASAAPYMERFFTSGLLDLGDKLGPILWQFALARADDAHHPEFAELTADFVYLRLRRCTEAEPTGYSPDAIDRWAAQAK